MDIPSHWSIGRKLVALVLFTGIIASVYWLAHKAFNDWIPTQFVGYIAVAIVCLSGGWILGDRSARKEIAANGNSHSTNREK